jgi:hypothetical protein
LPARKSRPGVDRDRGRPHAKPDCTDAGARYITQNWDFADRVRGLASGARNPAGGTADRSHYAAQEVVHLGSFERFELQRLRSW